MVRQQLRCVCSLQLLEFSSEDELPEVESSVEEEITVQHPQPVVARLLAEMEEGLLANNLDQRYSVEYAIEQVAQDTSNISRRSQLAGQVGYSLSPQDFRNSIEASGLTRRNSRANAQELLIRRGCQFYLSSHHIKGLLLIMLVRCKS